jgi:long-subunit fatty acid transport protein
MSQAELRPTSDPSFTSENNFIGNTLAGVSTLRVGGEYRINQVSLRGGYRFEQSPYANGQTIGDLNGFSAGLGYHFGPSRLDLAFSRSERDRETFLYDVGFNTPATVNSINTNITLGYTLNF